MSKRKLEDSIGQRYGRLLILNCYKDGNFIICKCICDCSIRTDKTPVLKVKDYQLRKEGRKSCGCLREDKFLNYNSTDYLEDYPYYDVIYKKWNCYWNKCYNPKQNSNYTEKGIIMCPEWADKKYGATVFYLWAIGKGFKEGDRIERIDKSLGYYPFNCNVVKSEWYKRVPINKQVKPKTISKQSNTVSYIYEHNPNKPTDLSVQISLNLNLSAS